MRFFAPAMLAFISSCQAISLNKKDDKATEQMPIYDETWMNQEMERLFVEPEKDQYRDPEFTSLFQEISYPKIRHNEDRDQPSPTKEAPLALSLRPLIRANLEDKKPVAVKVTKRDEEKAAEKKEDKPADRSADKAEVKAPEKKEKSSEKTKVVDDKSKNVKSDAKEDDVDLSSLGDQVMSLLGLPEKFPEA